MNLSSFIASKLGKGKTKSFTRLIVRFAIAGIALSLAVMILSVGIVIGFKSEIKQKIIGYHGHVQIRNLDLNHSKEARLVPLDTFLVKKISSNKSVAYVQAYTNKAGLMQSEGQIEGLVFKGLPANFHPFFFEKSLLKGRMPLLNDSTDTYELVVSNKTAQRMNLDTGMYTNVYFIQNGAVRRRRPLVVGVFNTGLAEFDEAVALTDMRVLQRIYTTGYDSISGYEVFLTDFNKMVPFTGEINNILDFNLRATNAAELNSVIFDWLEIVDTNAEVIILLMIIVAIINMCTALLILIVERTNMIGILKALGANNKQIRKIFINKGVRLVAFGVLVGNALGLIAGLVLTKFEPIELDESIYYMDAVPFSFDLTWILALNVGTLLICFGVMLIPALLVNKVSPIKAIRFN
jgi:lipoprotein-releasing system permease protein